MRAARRQREGPRAVTSALERLEAVTSNLDAYIGRRAAELAAPLVQVAEEAARAQVAEARQKQQRAEDLVVELRRHLDARENQLDDLRIKHGERRDPFVAERREQQTGRTSG